MRSEKWPLSQRDISDLLKTLCFDYFKWDADACGKCLILTDSLVLSRAEHEQAVSISERFGKILIKLETALLNRPDLLTQLGIPPDIINLLNIEQPDSLQLARYDLFLTPDGRWIVSEFNEDVPGGFNEADGLPNLLGPYLNGTNFTGNLRRSILDALRPYRHIALFYATGYSEDLQHMLIVRKWLEEDGHTTELAAPSHLRAGWRGPRVFGRRCDAAFRFYPGEWFRFLDNKRDWEKSLPVLPMMNPVRRLIRQSKRLFAFWRDPNLLERDDITFIENHAPITQSFESAPEVQDRSKWVLKHAFGRMGDTVIMGNLIPEKEWELALAEARKAPQEWLLQERFEVATMGDSAKPLYPALGVYLVNHQFAGYYSRAAYHPFINHEAYHVATLVETA